MKNYISDFSDVTTADFLGTDFTMKSTAPLIKPFDSFVVADPSLLTPDKTPDGKWHMFFHTNLGVYHFVSDDGLRFEKVCRVVRSAMRPNVNRIDNKYYLFFEKTRCVAANALNLIGITKWKSEIYVTESTDLKSWSVPRPAVTHSTEYENTGKGYSLSNPFFLPGESKNRLYYSCGLTFIRDCGFSEPTYVFCAESDGITSGYVKDESPVIRPDKNDPYLNLCSGCLKVYRFADGYIGILNGIYEKQGKSHSAILALTSADGKQFSFAKVLVEPGRYGAGWMKQFVYASCLVRYENELRLYFNGRDTSNMLRGRECIGFVSRPVHVDG